MQNVFCDPSYVGHRRSFTKLIPHQAGRIMKLTAFILLIACLQVSANTGAQTITLSLKNASLETVFKEIKKQAGYDFVYNDELIQTAKKIDLDVNQVSVEEVLQRSFLNQPFTYAIIEKTIVVKPKDPSTSLGFINEQVTI